MFAADTLEGDIAAVGEVAGNAEVGGIVAAVGAGRRRVGSSSARTEAAADTVGTVVGDLGHQCFAFAEFLQTLSIPGLPVLEQVLSVDIDRSLLYFVLDQRCLEKRIVH